MGTLVESRFCGWSTRKHCFQHTRPDSTTANPYLSLRRLSSTLDTCWIQRGEII